jgi:hypothetical protein
MTVKSHRDLGVWNRSVELTVAVYALCARLPRVENYAWLIR